MATGAYSTSVGYGTSASGANSVALGSVAASSGTSSVALGYGSNDGGAANVVSIGRANATRRIINVTAGSADTDVVNVAQLRSVSQAFGGGASFAGGTFVAPVYGIQGVNYNDVGSAFAKVNETIKYIAAGSATAFNAPSVYAGSNGLAIGSSAISNAASGLAIGNGAAVRSADPSQGGGGTAVGQAARVDGSGTAVGLGASVYRTDNALTITQATAIGDSAHVNASGGTALGANAQALVTGSVALGAGSVADQANTVSIGDSTSSGNATTRRLVNLSAGQQATDAVNVGQLNTATQALGAGASYVGGVFVAPTYNIQGGSYSNVGSALNAVDSSLTSITTAAGDTLRWNASIGGYDASRAGEPSQVRNVQAGTASTDAVNVDQLNAVAAGSVLAVQYDSVGKTTITLGGSGIGHAVAIDNLADGQIAAGSHDAINGSQLFNANLVVNNLGASMANVFGGGASYAGGIFTAPVFMVQGGSFNTVAAAFNAVDAKLTTIDQRTTVLEGTGGGGVGPQGPQGPAGSSAYQLASANGFTGSESAWLASLQGKDGKNGSNGTNGVGGDASNALVYDGSSVTVAPGQAPAQVKNVASGTSGTDAVNVAQLDQAITTAKSYSDSGDGKTLSSANTYTDQRISQLNSALDDRFHKVDQRIDRTGAMGTAMSQMAMAGAGASEGGRVAAGVGLQGSAGAVAVGFAAPIGDRTHVNFGGAFSTGTATVGAGIGFDLR
jgi:autotransporter adhesin